MEAKNLGGRPAHYKTPEELEKKVNEYFNLDTCPDKRMVTLKSFEEGNKGEYIDYVPHFTITGLALHLGFESRQSIYDYMKRNPEFSYILKKATTRVEQNYENLLVEKGVQTGAIFALKNMGWKDRQDITTDDKPIENNIAIVPSRKDAEEWGK